jgi:hypothetical protein
VPGGDAHLPFDAAVAGCAAEATLVRVGDLLGRS